MIMIHFENKETEVFSLRINFKSSGKKSLFRRFRCKCHVVASFVVQFEDNGEVNLKIMERLIYNIIFFKKNTT